MKLRFCKRKLARGWEKLDALAQHRVSLLWDIFNPDEYPTVDALLQHEELSRWIVRNEHGVAVAEWWQCEDAGLLFEGLSITSIGHAIQHGFVCRDRVLWKALASARHLPPRISWSLGKDIDPVPTPFVHTLEAWSKAVASRAPTPRKESKKQAQTNTRHTGSPATPPASNAQHPGIEKNEFQKHEHVLIAYDGDWYPGRIENIHLNPTYLVSYEGYDASSNEIVDAKRLRGLAPKR